MILRLIGDEETRMIIEMTEWIGGDNVVKTNPVERVK